MTNTLTRRRGRMVSPDRAAWLAGWEETKIDLENARERFNMATQPELIEQCVYEINALMARQAYFWRVIREASAEEESA